MQVYPKYYFNQVPKEKARTCFVMMPFKSEFDKVYRAIHSALEHPDINFDCIRGDEVLQPHILETILQRIADSEVIVADLSGQNPNVFYELGLAHCVKEPKALLLLTQKAEDIPFDLRQYRHIIYEPTEEGLLILQSSIHQSMMGYLGTEYPVALREGEQFTLPKLMGDDKYLYECSIYCAFVGGDGAKLEFMYKKCKSNGKKIDVNAHGEALGTRDSLVKLLYIPWDFHFIKIDGKPPKLTAVLRPRAVMTPSNG